MNNYERGFITKCAEYGVDPDELIKQASKGFRKAFKLAKRMVDEGKRLPENLKQIMDTKYSKINENTGNLRRLGGLKEALQDPKLSQLNEIKDWNTFIDTYFETPFPKKLKMSKPVQSVFKTKQYTEDAFRKLFPDKDYVFRIANGGGIYEKNKPYWVSGKFDAMRDFASNRKNSKGGVLMEIRRRIDLPEYRKLGDKIFHEHTATANKQLNLKARYRVNKFGRISYDIDCDPDYEAVINGRTMQNRDIVQYFRLYPTKGGKLMVRTDSGRLADNAPASGLGLDIPSINSPDSFKNWRNFIQRNNQTKKNLQEYVNVKNLDLNKLKSTDFDGKAEKSFFNARQIWDVLFNNEGLK